ncbi:MAG TPA: hypothetical protein VGN56_01260 [Candidatus Paceibacterota bacterium]|jgi:hypothetical protein|nr:hypothetical protein [Candidatus Paceibacterota bacterium]
MIRVSAPARAGIIILACIAPFVFPSAVTAVLAFAAALIFPPLAILLGMLTDLLYEPSGYWPLASMIGVLLCVAALLVRSFVKARIM